VVLPAVCKVAMGAAAAAAMVVLWEVVWVAVTASFTSLTFVFPLSSIRNHLAPGPSINRIYSFHTP
jgi:hypothetical protein